jgi:hypothetical protein
LLIYSGVRVKKGIAVVIVVRLRSKVYWLDLKFVQPSTPRL